MFDSRDSNFFPLPPHLRMGIQLKVGDQIVATGDRGDANDTYTVCVGQILQCTATSDVPILAVWWLVNGSAVADYSITSNAGVVTPISPSMYATNPLRLAFVTAGTCSVGVYITTACGRGYVQHNFDVTAPHINFFDSHTGHVYVGPSEGKTYLRFGTPSDPSGPGITINAVLYGTQSTRGRVGILQLAVSALFGFDDNDRPWHWSNNGTPVLDVGPGGAYIFYQNEVKELPQGGNADLQITDAPAVQLASPLQYVAVGNEEGRGPEVYKSYLMFAPADGAAIFVPLSVLTWSWNGYSLRTSEGWGPVQRPGNTVDPSGTPTAEFPVWSSNTLYGHWVSGFGRGRTSAVR